MLREWLLHEVIGGPNSIGHPNISGLFIDDFWCSNITNGTCTDPVQGPTEIDRHSQAGAPHLLLYPPKTPPCGTTLNCPFVS